MEQKYTILIADDDKETANTLVEHITDQGYIAEVAHDGEEAMTKLSSGKIDLVILDLKMPKVNGFEILSHIKKNIPSTKVVILTAYADYKNTEICKRLGADHILTKPFDLEILFWTINMVLKGQKKS